MSSTTATRPRLPPRFAFTGNERAYALLGAVTIAFSSILVRLSHASPSTAAIFRCAYALPILAILAWREDRRFGARSWRERRAGLIAGVFFAADLLLWHHSIGDVGAGLATVLANIQVVLLPLVAWALLSERPAPRVLVALPISLVGVLLISGVLEHGAYGRNPTRGAIFGIGAGVAYVGFLLMLRRGGSDLRRPAGPLCDATAVSAVLCVAAGLVIGDARLVPSWPGAGWLITLALTSQVLGWLIIGATLPRLPAAMTSLLLTVQPIGTLALAALIFGEDPSGLQLAGVLLVLVGLLVASLSRQRLSVGPSRARTRPPVPARRAQEP
ncbi:MAG TPA: DMT family transporter [Solirubrobacteraceae bacterium]|nr:DMT family transporter [Solirubrobacteraceae bacterium]